MKLLGLNLQKNILSHLLKNFSFRGCEILMWQRRCKYHGSYYGRIKWLHELTLQIFYVPHLFNRSHVRFSIHWRSHVDLGLFLRNGPVIERRIFLTLQLPGTGISCTLTKTPVCFLWQLGFSHDLASLTWVSSCQWVSACVLGIAKPNGETDWLVLDSVIVTTI
jgi:hypothetical protein